MRHLTFLRIYQPLEHLPKRIQSLAQDAAKRSRADIEAEAAERLNRRLRPEADSTFPNTSDPPIIRYVELKDAYGKLQQYFHVNYIARATFEATYMRRKYYDDELYKLLVPQDGLDTFEKISELQADAGLVSRPINTFYMDLWSVPLHWHAIFGGAPETHQTNKVTEDIIDGTTVIRRLRDINSAYLRIGEIQRLLAFYGPEPYKHPYHRNMIGLLRWFRHFYHHGSEVRSVVELDYGALSKYAWPDKAGKLLEEGHDVLARIYQLDDELEMEEPETYPGLPPAMLEQAAKTMGAKYQAAQAVWKCIQRYEYAN
ncbi:MAG: hypothetical protein HLX51_14800 [Micrococcaceae bacterium]|nr:hypothetical protein [Micrococcaceae bacterium]